LRRRRSQRQAGEFEGPAGEPVAFGTGRGPRHRPSFDGDVGDRAALLLRFAGSGDNGVDEERILRPNAEAVVLAPCHAADDDVRSAPYFDIRPAAGWAGGLQQHATA
jgi:hypothetical protein